MIKSKQPNSVIGAHKEVINLIHFPTDSSINKDTTKRKTLEENYRSISYEYRCQDSKVLLEHRHNCLHMSIGVFSELQQTIYGQLYIWPLPEKVC